MDEIVIAKDIKFSELEFKEKAIKKYSEKVKKQKVSLLWMLNVEFFNMIKYSQGSVKKVDDSIASLIQKMKSSLFTSTKTKFI